MSKKVLITGANRGIGLELVKRQKALGHEVYGLCRKTSEALIATGAIFQEGIDVTDFEGLKKAANQWEHLHFDLIICNAGLFLDEKIQDFSDADIVSCLSQFEVNTLGPLKTFSAFRHLLNEGGKVAMITSRMGSIADNTSGGHYGYRMSKCALNMATQSLVHDFPQFSFGLFHPGWVQTEMTGHTGQLKPDESARLLSERIEGLNAETNGSFWHCDGERLPW